MPTITPDRRRPRAGGLRRPRPCGRRGDDGQSLVEFALILPALLLLLLGIIQFGFIFNAYVTLSSAVRESARVATVYVYDTSITRAQNDLARNNLAKTTLINSFNGLNSSSPNFSIGSTWTTTTSGTTVTATNGDLTVSYVLPSTVTDNDPRQGYRFTVTASYHQDIILPIIGAFLPLDVNGRLPLRGLVAMVLN